MSTLDVDDVATLNPVVPWFTLLEVSIPEWIDWEALAEQRRADGIPDEPTETYDALAEEFGLVIRL